ncbi:hypothetical protein BY457_103151 [Marinilabilia salmonicolor]|jgi:hypothetical protein|uniref:hypothetical protein n=1 Tax=Marinilabilia salmonicolor TaxID=989 RepID=UPI000D0782B8|nr:hypothetical protein [Marinilabilia salmonicolor]PRZ01336.1 hypothetical protein BY457_103151 [Marinilabilia salmonicolor]
MQKTQKKSSERGGESLITGFFIDKEDLNDQDFPALKRRLRHKMLSYYLPVVIGFTILFLIKEKTNYDYILFFVVLIFSAILYYLVYRNNLLKLKIYFSSKEK